MNFDLISDLNLNDWPNDKQINFDGIGTSTNCVVAGGVSNSLTDTREFLYKLSDYYNHIIYVDGAVEHLCDYENIEQNCVWLEKEICKKSNITYLWDTTFIAGDIAFVGVNGWWTFDYMAPHISRLDHIEQYCAYHGVDDSVALKIWDEAAENSDFLKEVVDQLDEVSAIQKIVIVTHTLPRNDLISSSIAIPPIEAATKYNSFMPDVARSSKKIKLWCHGAHHQQAIDKTINGIRYVSNPRGKPSTTIFPIYYPKLLNV